MTPQRAKRILGGLEPRKPGRHDIGHHLLICGDAPRVLRRLAEDIAEAFGLDRKVERDQGTRPLTLVRRDLECLMDLELAIPTKRPEASAPDALAIRSLGQRLRREYHLRAERPGNPPEPAARSPRLAFRPAMAPAAQQKSRLATNRKAAHKVEAAGIAPAITIPQALLPHTACVYQGCRWLHYGCTDAALAELIERWADLPAHITQSIMILVRSLRPGG